LPGNFENKIKFGFYIKFFKINLLNCSDKILISYFLSFFSSGLSIPYSYFYHWPAPPCASVEEFYCDNHKCISRILRCDGYDHCGDSSDEMCKGGEIHIE